MQGDPSRFFVLVAAHFSVPLSQIPDTFSEPQLAAVERHLPGLMQGPASAIAGMLAGLTTR